MPIYEINNFGHFIIILAYICFMSFLTSKSLLIYLLIHVLRKLNLKYVN